MLNPEEEDNREGKQRSKTKTWSRKKKNRVREELMEYELKLFVLEERGKRLKAKLTQIV